MTSSWQVGRLLLAGRTNERNSPISLLAPTALERASMPVPARRRQAAAPASQSGPLLWRRVDDKSSKWVFSLTWRNLVTTTRKESIYKLLVFIFLVQPQLNSSMEIFVETRGLSYIFSRNNPVTPEPGYVSLGLGNDSRPPLQRLPPSQGSRIKSNTEAQTSWRGEKSMWINVLFK